MLCRNAAEPASQATENAMASAYEFHKLHWSCLALRRVAQYAKLGIRHNDIKPDNIVLDFFESPNGTNETRLDVKIIDLGTASLQSARDFTGGTSWYESPEQKILEYHTKKHRNPEAARAVEIGLASDLWGAGLSISEVVDALKAPHGPGPLEFLGTPGCWAVAPADWVACGRKALGLERAGHRYPFCAEGARVVFDGMVVPAPDNRMKISEALSKLEALAEEAFKTAQFKQSLLPPSQARSRRFASLRPSKKGKPAVQCGSCAESSPVYAHGMSLVFLGDESDRSRVPRFPWRPNLPVR
eukprot:Polyplicarium_translucidae@DN3528_c0_g1_i2.p1